MYNHIGNIGAPECSYVAISYFPMQSFLTPIYNFANA